MNELQRKAANVENGYVQIIAGPGTGKTVTLVSRIIALLDRGILPHEICVLSFSRAAARELKERVANKLNTTKCPIIVGTFHSIAFRWLKKYGGLEFADLSVIDDHEKTEILSRYSTEQLPVKQLASLISRKQVFGDELSEDAQQIYASYMQLTRSLNRVDYDTLLTKFLDFLTREHSKVQSKLRAVLVDEFQDTSLVQLKISMALVNKCHNLTVVGDPDQSIYAFRNANPGNFNEMLVLVNQIGHTAHQLVLENNYRSTQQILNAASRVANMNADRFASNRKLRAMNYTGDSARGLQVKFAACKSEHRQASEIAEHAALLIKHGLKPQEIGILARSTREFYSLESELLLHGIGVRMVGGKPRMLTREARGVIDYIRVALNSNDSLALLRTINFPSRKIGPKALAQVCEDGDMSPNGFPVMHLVRKHSYSTPFNEYATIIDKIMQLLDGGTLDGIKRVIEYCFTHLFATSSTSSTTLDSKSELLKTADRFAEILEEDLIQNEGSFAELFTSIWALESTNQHNSTQNDERVTLSTIHSAKGLEWPVVFVTGVSGWAREQPQNASEEARLLYVALTRAKCYLVVTSSTASLDEHLNLNPKKPPSQVISSEIDTATLSHCVNRPIVPPKPKRVETKDGSGFDLADGFMLASELPLDNQPFKGPTNEKRTKKSQVSKAKKPEKANTLKKMWGIS